MTTPSNTNPPMPTRKTRITIGMLYYGAIAMVTALVIAHFLCHAEKVIVDAMAGLTLVLFCSTFLAIALSGFIRMNWLKSIVSICFSIILLAQFIRVDHDSVGRTESTNARARIVSIEIDGKESMVVQYETKDAVFNVSTIPVGITVSDPRNQHEHLSE